MFEYNICHANPKPTLILFSQTPTSCFCHSVGTPAINCFLYIVFNVIAMGFTSIGILPSECTHKHSTLNLK